MAPFLPRIQINPYEIWHPSQTSGRHSCMLWKVWHAASGYIILPIEIRPSGPTKTIIASHPSVAQSEIYRHQPTANPQTKADTTEFRRIAALADLLLGTNDGVDVDLRSLTNRRLETDPWTLDHSGGNVVVLLSDVYTVIRELEAQSSQPCRDRDRTRSGSRPHPFIVSRPSTGCMMNISIGSCWLACPICHCWYTVVGVSSVQAADLP